MKILCIADHKDPLVYSTNMKNRFSDVDFVLSAGDLPLEYYGFIASMLNKPILFVFGNHCLDKLSRYRLPTGRVIRDGYSESYLMRDSYGATYIGGAVKKVKGVVVAGLGGSRIYNKGQNQFSEFEMFMHIANLIPRMLWFKITTGRWVDILLTHAPPF